MSLGNLDIKNIIVGQRQVATAWLGPIKLWPKAPEIPLVVLDAFQASQIDTASIFTSMNIGKVSTRAVGEILTGKAKWSETTAQISYYYNVTGEYEGQEVTLQSTILTATSSTFEQNLTDQPVTRDVTFVAADGNTYNAQVIQEAYSAHGYTLTLTGITSYGFTKDSTFMPNLDAATYDGIYKSNNQGYNNTYAVARIDFQGYTEFTVWINSYAESFYDYTITSQLDASTYPKSNSEGYNGNGYSTEYSSSAGKFSNTNAFQNMHSSPNKSPSEQQWRKVTYACDTGGHHIFITYRKDSSSYGGDDTGCFIVQKGQ